MPIEYNGASLNFFGVCPLRPLFLLPLARRNVIYNQSETFQLFCSHLSTEKQCLGVPCQLVHPDFRSSLSVPYRRYVGVYA